MHAQIVLGADPTGLEPVVDAAVCNQTEDLVPGLDRKGQGEVPGLWPDDGAVQKDRERFPGVAVVLKHAARLDHRLKVQADQLATTDVDAVDLGRKACPDPSLKTREGCHESA